MFGTGPLMQSSTPASTHVVLVGGGHAHVTVIREFGMRPQPGVVVTVVTRELDAPYSGMLPGFVAGHYSYDDVHIDVIGLASAAGARVIHGEVTGIDRAKKQIAIAGRAPLSYDLLSIDVGTTPKIDDIEGACDHALAVKPVSAFARKWRDLEAAALTESGPRRFLVVGAGAAGFELVLAMRHRLLGAARARGLDMNAFAFTLVGSGPLLPTHNPRARKLAFRQIVEQRVTLIEGRRVVAIGADAVRLDTGTQIAADATLLTTNAGPAAWFASSGLPLDDTGFIAVRPTLQLLDDDDVFAVGDCATVLEHRREKAGVFAVRQGPPLTENLRLRARGLKALPFVPQKDFLTLLSTGGHHAIAARNGLAVAGEWVWRWKDRIDRDFMAMFSDAVEMREGDEDMRCAGCAAKVGPLTLAHALDRVGGGNGRMRDDAAMFDEAGDMVRLETIDFFKAFWPEPYLFGEIAAVHAMSDVFAMGGKPSHALANVVLPHASPARMQEDLVQLLAGATRAIEREDAAIVGGHTSEGADLAAGFFIAGRARREGVLLKSGLRAGDRLVLTRPLGTGILFAGLMRGLARGRSIATALDTMRTSNRAAAEVLLANGATAATDITGFGLAGHLLEMLDASNAGARIALDDVPLYPGVSDLARRGIASTLLPENLRLASRLQGAATSDPAAMAILFDPQTSGGLLAGIPADRLEDCVADLAARGLLEAMCIGEVTSDAGIVIEGALPAAAQ